MGIAVGIDLGTSNSVVTTVIDGKATVLADEDGRRIHPSVVAFGYGHSVVVGNRARQQIAYAPENTVFSAKRLMGRRAESEEADRVRRIVGWGVAAGPNGDARIRVQGKVYAVQEISAHVLQHMKQWRPLIPRHVFTAVYYIVPVKGTYRDKSDVFDE